MRVVTFFKCLDFSFIIATRWLNSSCLLGPLYSATHGSSKYLIGQRFELTVSLLSSSLSLSFPPQEWYPHFFVLTSSKIYYSEETSSNQGNDDEEEHREVSGPDLLLMCMEMRITSPDFKLAFVTGAARQRGLLLLYLHTV